MHHSDKIHASGITLAQYAEVEYLEFVKIFVTACGEVLRTQKHAVKFFFKTKKDNKY